jgi:hypothetical protein
MSEQIDDGRRTNYEQRAVLSIQAHTRLMKLLPKLSAVTDQHRLKVLSDIDRVLAAEGLTWADIAEALNEPQGEDLAATEVLSIIERIQQEHTVLLTNNARSFLDQLRERAMENNSVHFSFRQGQWLYALQEQAERERERERLRRDDNNTYAPDSPVWINMARIEKLIKSASLTEGDSSFLTDLCERMAAMRKRSVQITHQEWSRLSHLEYERQSA